MSGTISDLRSAMTVLWPTLRYGLALATLVFALTLANEAEAGRGLAPADSIEEILSLKNNAERLAEQGKIDQALAELTRANAAAIRAFGAGTPLSADIEGVRANILLRAYRYEEAATSADIAILIYRNLLAGAQQQVPLNVARAYLTNVQIAVSIKEVLQDCEAAFEITREATALPDRLSTEDRTQIEPLILSMVARTSIATNRLDDAKTWIEKLDRLGVESDALHLNLALRRGDAGIAEAIVTRRPDLFGAGLSSIDHTPIFQIASIELDIKRARAAGALGKIEAAEKYLEHAARPNRFVLGELAYLKGKALILAGRYLEAELAFERAEKSFDFILLPEAHSVHPSIDHARAIIHQQLDEEALAEALYQRAISLFESARCPAENRSVQTRIERSILLRNMGRFSEAESAARSAISTKGFITENVQGYAWSVLGFALSAQRRDAEALSAFSQAFERFEEGNEIDLPPGLLEASKIHLRNRKFDEAAQSTARAAAIYRAAGLEDAAYAMALSQLALIELRRPNGSLDKALRNSKQATDLLRRQHEFSDARNPDGTLREHFVFQSAFDIRVEALARQYFTAPNPETEEALIQAMQEGRRRSTATAMEAASQKFARTDRRKSEQLMAIRAIQAKLDGIAWASTDSLGEENGGSAAIALQGERRKLEAELANALAELRSTAPEFYALFMPDALSIDSIRREILHEGDGLLIHYALVEESIVAFVGEHEIRIWRNHLGARSLSDLEREVRESLQLNPGAKVSDIALPNFDALFDLYKEFLAPILEISPRISHLLVVADGPLQRMPFHMFLTKEYHTQDIRELRNAPWALFLDLTFSYLPTVSSARAIGGGDQDISSFLGVGDPELKRDLNEESRGKREICSPDGRLVTRGLADRNLLNNCYLRLAQTADEILSIAGRPSLSTKKVLLGRDATETKLKSLSDLKSFDVIVFATHAIMPGELGSSRAGLVLTPPENATSQDDGFLSESEIVSLDANAEFVILSACNTASASGRSLTESYSGLARAFFFAGARELLVSNWYVDSAATKSLTTALFDNISSEGGKAAAFHAAMKRVIRDGSKSYYGHPVFWGPFVLVGDGR
ncbi:MAG: CHAT domain-containing protein [Parvularculaceae bacterium]